MGEKAQPDINKQVIMLIRLKMGWGKVFILKLFCV